MGGKSGRAASLSLAVVLGLLSVFLFVDQAAAHNSLTGSSPANGARLAVAPSRIELTFLARLQPQGTKITVTGPDNVPATAGRPTIAGSKVTVPFRLGAAGLYIVGYEVASSDGHPVEGEIRFTMTVGATPSAVPTSTPASSPVQPAFTDRQSPVASPLTPSTAGSTTDEGGSWWPWLLGAAVVVLAVLVALLLRRRSRAG